MRKIKCVLIAMVALVTISALELKGQVLKGAPAGNLLNVENPKGKKGPSTTFTGNAWAQILVANDSIYNCVIGSVTMSPGSRSFWHRHPSGQILYVTDGIGYYQERGSAVRVIQKGDVITCHPGIEHWHGASSDSWLIHTVISPNMEKGDVQWLTAVTENEYLGK